MQSADSGRMNQSEPDLDYVAVLEGYERRIQFYIDNGDWDELMDVLQTRQKYLESLQDSYVPEDSREALKSSLSRLLARDEVFQKDILRKRNDIFQQRSALETGRRAIDAYLNKN
jgi:hypothetical protein